MGLRCRERNKTTSTTHGGVVETIYQHVKKYVTNCQDMVTADIMKSHYWDVMNSAVQALRPRLPEGWAVDYQPSSVTFRSRTKKFVYKITMGHEVITDVRRQSHVFDSKKYRGASIEDACSHLLKIMERHLLVEATVH
jgi:hypothetical protein